jgi:sRNA-binding carbon storage regulator CsrA
MISVIQGLEVTMLVLTRKPGQAIEIRPDSLLDPQTPMATLFEAGPISISVAGVSGRTVRLGFQAHPQLCIVRQELLPPVVTEPVLSPPTRQALAQKLRLLRFIAQLSQEQLAQRAGIGQVTLMVAETGKGSIGLGDVERLARVLGVTVSELLRPPCSSWEERVVMALLEQGVRDE